MILTDSEILEAIKEKSIIIEPFDPNCLGPNSYDVHLGDTLIIYEDDILDIKKPNKFKYIKIPESGYILEPGKLYLGATFEYTETHKHVPCLEGKSSLARLGLNIQMAPLGNVHFCNHWTLEISSLQHIKIYPNIPIGQLLYFNINTDKLNKGYNTKPNAKYNEKSPLPKESMMWKNFQ
tara:strand:- start:2264 stop:2800 length:537 start_codon:yes stop_codon:yes gene_type:complete